MIKASLICYHTLLPALREGLSCLVLFPSKAPVAGQQQLCKVATGVAHVPPLNCCNIEGVVVHRGTKCGAVCTNGRGSLCSPSLPSTARNSAPGPLVNNSKLSPCHSPGKQPSYMAVIWQVHSSTNAQPCLSSNIASSAASWQMLISTWKQQPISCVLHLRCVWQCVHAFNTFLQSHSRL